MRVLRGVRDLVAPRLLERGSAALQQLSEDFGPRGVFARTRATGAAVLWIAVILFAILVLYYN